MLVLSRRVGERLVIGDDIVVTVIEVRSDGVRLGIDAPRSVAVHRAEVLEAVTAANLAATDAATDAGDDAVESLRGLVAGQPAPAAAPEPTPSDEDRPGR
ncbi:carbon storage regulator CsrA [Cellulomonas sp. Y8]|uniref:carbon storage regulator CsrA n=1 Tax=Cellulomonas sp. Y8 TaxID=2591145 RepID=UPI0011C8449E|nr:carbon storage regulator CsrA [Cellulomonas sp. Y8]